MTEIIIDGTITTDEGMTVPAKITIEYPDNQGLYIYKVLADHSDQIASQLISELVARGDLSVLGALDRAAERDEDEAGDV